MLLGRLSPNIQKSFAFLPSLPLLVPIWFLFEDVFVRRLEMQQKAQIAFVALRKTE